jgi:hypothetical protein
MKNIFLYIKWLRLQFTELFAGQNLRWVMIYAIFSLVGFFGLHLLFLKKYKRAIVYLITWAILIGSYIVTFYRPVSFMIFFAGLLLLAVVLLIDFINIYFVQTKKIGVCLPFILLLLFFCVQIFLYEYLAQHNSDFISEKVLSIAGRFSGVN